MSFSRQRRDRERHARQVDALVRADPAADDHGAARAAAVDLVHPEPDQAVVDQDVVAGLEHVADHRRRDRQLAVGRELLGADRDLLTRLQHHRLRETADTELRPLQVGDHRDRAADLVRDLPDALRARSRAPRACRARGSAAPRPSRPRRATRSCSTESDDGPSVATIFVRRSDTTRLAYRQGADAYCFALGLSSAPRGETPPSPGTRALLPSCSSMRSSWLYFATRSERAGAPVLI